MRDIGDQFRRTVEAEEFREAVERGPECPACGKHVIPTDEWSCPACGYNPGSAKLLSRLREAMHGK